MTTTKFYSQETGDSFEVIINTSNKVTIVTDNSESNPYVPPVIDLEVADVKKLIKILNKLIIEVMHGKTD